jgi:cytochrome c-type protein NapB
MRRPDSQDQCLNKKRNLDAMKAERRSHTIPEPWRSLLLGAVGFAVTGCLALTEPEQPARPDTDEQKRTQPERIVAPTEPGETIHGAQSEATPLPSGRSGGDRPPRSAIDPQAKIAVLAERAELRAYFGAPPVIPHDIGQFDSAANCLGCHGPESGDGDDANPKIPHVQLSSCTQCHVVQEIDLFVEEDIAANEFRGLAEAARGHRAWPGAPPTIPHSTLMRSRCLSCHGPTRPAGIRSSHPQRLSCRQCHAPSAMLNQRLVGDDQMFLPPPAIEAP